MNELLPIGTLVYHNGHGNGTIVAYNGVQRNEYIEKNLGSPEVAAASMARLMDGIVESFFSSDRYPYVVQFEPTEEYSDGYKDVYDVDGTVMKVRELSMPVFAAGKIDDEFVPTRTYEGIVLRG